MSSPKTFEIGGVKIGGIHGQVPTVLIGSMFYNKHYIVKDEVRGEFDRQEAERLIKQQEEFSDKTGNPHMIDVVGATTEALNRHVDFVTGVTKAPILLDGISAGVRMESLDHIRDVGLIDRVVYNSITPDYKQDELDKIQQIGVKSSILLAFNSREFTSQGRIKAIKQILPVAQKAGIEKPMIDTVVLDIPSLGMACRAIRELSAEFGLPTGSGAHNAVGTWKGLKKKMGKQAKDPSMAAACAITIAAGANFVLYGPIEFADYMFPTLALVDAVYAQMAIEQGRMPDRQHPIFKIA
jgi:tetrahydromethanopterin S-methyltransferase subunit H